MNFVTQQYAWRFLFRSKKSGTEYELKFTSSESDAANALFAYKADEHSTLPEHGDKLLDKDCTPLVDGKVEIHTLEALGMSVSHSDTEFQRKVQTYKRRLKGTHEEVDI